MKKTFFHILTAVLLALCLALPISAAQDAEQAKEQAVAVEDQSNDTAQDAERQEESEAARNAEWFFNLFLSHFSDIAVAAAAVWLAFPKWGGVAVLVRLLRHIRTYFDDAGNSRSVYNVLAANADAMARFMNDAAPLLADLREGRAALEQAKTALDAGERLTAEQTKTLTAARRSLSLLAAELCRVVSALPDTDEAARVRFEALTAALTGEDAGDFASLGGEGVTEGDERSFGEHEKADLAV